MHILLTRPKEDGAETARRLEALGHRVTLSPVMTIALHDGPPPDLAGVQAILFTSANGVRAFANRTDARGLPVLAVGEATAAAARAIGFTDVSAASGDVHSLAALTARLRDPADGPLFHGAGAIVAGDLLGLLAPHGFTVRRSVLYEAVAAPALDPNAVAALEAGTLDLALFYSPRTARIFMELAARAKLLSRLETISAGALSGAVRNALQSAPWRRIVVARTPSEAALLAAAGLVGGGEQAT